MKQAFQRTRHILAPKGAKFYAMYLTQHRAKYAHNHCGPARLLLDVFPQEASLHHYAVVLDQWAVQLRIDLHR